jgi:tryptophanyl-tRNA synthetase
VGKDQAAHLELAREIVRAFNSRYGQLFVEPEAVFTDSPIVKGTDGVNKMSKSLGNVVEIFADEATISKQVMSMVTDTQRILRTDPGRPEVCNVCQLHRFVSPDYETIWEGERTARTGCVDTKKLLAERLLSTFAEARERRRELAEQPGYVEEVLRAGAERLAAQARDTMDEVHDRMGLGAA